MEEEIILIEESKKEKEISLENEPAVYQIGSIGNAEDIVFEDGTTLQEKFDNGELKGEPGEKGEPGQNGTNGTDGKDGYTPVKGIDYYTEEEKQELVSLVLNELPNSREVSY